MIIEHTAIDDLALDLCREVHTSKSRYGKVGIERLLEHTDQGFR